MFGPDDYKRFECDWHSALEKVDSIRSDLFDDVERNLRRMLEKHLVRLTHYCVKLFQKGTLSSIRTRSGS